MTWRQGSDGGSPLTRQIIRVYHRGVRIGSVRVSGSVTAVKVTGLRPGRWHRFTVTGRNVVGRSAESARSNAVRPRR